MAIKLPLGETDPAYWNLHPAYLYNPTDDSFCDPFGTKVSRKALHYRREQQMCGHAGGSHNWQQTQLQAQASAAQLQMLAMAQSQANLGVPGSLAAGFAAPVAPHNKWTKPSESIVAGEIMAWRIWKISARGTPAKHQYRLCSMAADYIWEPKQIANGDVLRGFGIHAYKDAYGPASDGYASGCCVIGRVALWGDVIEHEYGYRAQYAKVHSLDHWLRSVTDKVRKEIEAAYL